MADVFVENSGYRPRYPHVAVAANRLANREGGVGPEWKARQNL